LLEKEKSILDNKDLILKIIIYYYTRDNNIFDDSIDIDYINDIGGMLYSVLMQDKISKISISKEEENLIKLIRDKRHFNADPYDSKQGTEPIIITAENRKIYLQYLKAKKNHII
jgi:hypothetical protein